MAPNSVVARILRFIGILFMSLTAGFTILGGAGTTCAALLPMKWDSMAPLAKMQWLYILYVIVTIAIGVFGIRVVVKLVKGDKDAYKTTLITLIAGILIGGLHIFTSRMLRGSSMPVDAVVYMTVLTLVIFLILRIPPIWKGVDYSKAPKKEKKKSAGAASIVVGILCLNIQFLMASTHTWNGVNYSNAYQTAMTLSALICIIVGTIQVIPIQPIAKRVKEFIQIT